MALPYDHVHQTQTPYIGFQARIKGEEENIQKSFKHFISN